MAIEQSSRFRAYSNPTAQPSIGYRVVDHIIVYDLIPPSPTFSIGELRTADMFAVIAELDLDSLINQEGVREIWLTAESFDSGYPSYDPAIHDLQDARWIPESNMSSALTGDVSNSYRLDDLPILDHTYVVYGLPWRRSQAEATHVVGHQLEAMFSHINLLQDGNSELFWQRFVGLDQQGRFVRGRSGSTHYPPNATHDYDYLNSSPFDSDIEDWRPDNLGSKSAVSVSTWSAHQYSWPGAQDFGQRIETQWYIYWMQSFPGADSQIPHGDQWMTNWWAIFADWDAAVAGGLGLYGPEPAAEGGAGVAFPSPAAAPVHPAPVHGSGRNGTSW